MFTGIVEAIGVIAEVGENADRGGVWLTIGEAESILPDAQLGDSISIDGTCLTITDLKSTATFRVGVAPETLRRTTLGSLRQGSFVNLERAVQPTGRMGGHFVQGHVDTVATVDAVTPDGEALTFRLRPRETSVLRYIVEKGYVTIDGASLTVTAVNDVEGWWEVMLIAYTQDKIVTARKRPLATVNVEVDILGKYVEKSVEAYFLDKDKTNGTLRSVQGQVQSMVQKAVAEQLSRS